MTTSYSLGVACAQPAPPVHGPGPLPCPGPVQVAADLVWSWTGSSWQSLNTSPRNTGIGGFPGEGSLVADPQSGHLEYFRGGLGIVGCGGWSGYQPAAG